MKNRYISYAASVILLAAGILTFNYSLLISAVFLVLFGVLFMGTTIYIVIQRLKITKHLGKFYIISYSAAAILVLGSSFALSYVNKVDSIPSGLSYTLRITELLVFGLLAVIGAVYAIGLTLAIMKSAYDKSKSESVKDIICNPKKQRSESGSVSEHKKKLRIRRIIIFILLIILCSAALYNGLAVREYILKTDKDGGNIRIVFLSDLHCDSYGKNQKNLMKKINTQKPDIILLGGDIYHSSGEFDNARTFLSEVTKIAPCYFVIGNHEYWSGRIHEIIDDMDTFGITLLSDEYREIEINGRKLIIAGTEHGSASGILKNSFGDLKVRDEYKILISHYPEDIEKLKKYGFDLVLSGHAHGGQFRLPFVQGGLYVPGQGVFPKYSGGYYDVGDTAMIVSRGLSRTHPKLPRIFNRPEIVTVIIE